MSKNIKKMIGLLVATTVAASAVPIQNTYAIEETAPFTFQKEEGLIEPRITTESAILYQVQRVTTAAIVVDPDNKVNNFSFEETSTTPIGICWGGNTYPKVWKGDNFSSTYASPIITLDSIEKMSGNYAIKFEATQKSDGKGTRGWASQDIVVKPNTSYTLEAWVKAENITDNRFGIQVLEYKPGTTSFVNTSITATLRIQVSEPTHEWKKYTAEFTTGNNIQKVAMRAFLGTHNEVKKGGIGWIDDVILKEKVVKVEGITLPTTLILAKNSFETLLASVKPNNAANKKVKWSSSDPSIASVTDTGKIFGIKPGQATITATTEDGSFTATTALTVSTELKPKNLAPNGGFEKTITDINAYWVGGKSAEAWNSVWSPSGDKGQKLSLDKTIFSEGIQSIHINSPSTAARIAFSNDIPIDSAKAYKLSLKIKTQDIQGAGAYFRTQYYDTTGKSKQGDGPVIEKIIGTNEWTAYQVVVKDIPSKTASLRVEIFLENASGDVWFDDVRLEETYGFDLDKKELSLLAGEQTQLKGIFTPSEIQGEKIAWSSSNREVATVDETGLVSAVVPGIATITAQTSQAHKAVCSVVVDDPMIKPYYKVLRKRWSDRLTGNNVPNNLDADYQKMMLTIAQEAQMAWDEMIKRPNVGEDTRAELWPTLDTATQSAHISKTFQSLRKMSIAYASKGCGLYKNDVLKEDILEGLDWMYAKRYNENVKSLYKNWWDWDIGAPQALCDTLILMYESLTPKQIENEMKALNRFNPSPFKVPNGPAMTGANLLDTALVSALKGLIGDSNKALTEAKEAISQTLPYVTKGDGFYEDGSFIQHGNIPYAGGYGATIMTCMDKLMFVLTETPWKVTDPLIQNMYDWMLEAFKPFYYKGAIMDMVGGRGITRETKNDHTRGKGILLPMLQLSYAAPQAIGDEIRSFIKENIVNDTLDDDYFKNMTVRDMLAVKTLLEDTSSVATGDLNLYKTYASMDRAVVHRPGFSLGISMYSSRIGNFEYGNGENKKGYHTSDGMLYLYNKDHQQYAKDYWPTADMMRLPGTTTDKSLATVRDWYAYSSSKNWVGGSSLYALYGATGMNFEMEKSSLEGKKSWFSFDDEIVCLGAGITATDNTPVETIVENRKINGDNTLIINGDIKSTQLGWSEKMPQVKWALLGGNTASEIDTIGYYFPQETSLTGLRESRTGSWKDINVDGSPDPITRNYLSLAIEHGKNPSSTGYSYVLLPNKQAREVEKYSQNADITILQNTEKVQAVRETKLGIVGMNFWEAETVDYITANNPCSIMLDEKQDQLNLGISDPTQKATEITLMLDKQNYEVVTKDPTVTIGNVGDKIEVRVNVASTAGKTHHVQLRSKVQPPQNTPVESIKLDKTKRLLIVGKQEIVVATVMPQEASNKEVTWQIDKPEYVGITDNKNNTVILEGLKEGIATLTATTIDGNFTATCEVRVKKKDSESNGSESNGSGSGSSSSKPSNESTSDISRDKTIQEQWNSVKEALPYTLLAKNYTIEELDKLTNNQFTKKQLEEIQKDMSILKDLGININSQVVELKNVENPEFKDILENHWAYKDIKALAKIGIVMGDTEGNFKPKEVLTVEDTFTFLDRMLLLKGVTQAKLSNDTVEKYITNKESWAYYPTLSVSSKLTENTLNVIAKLEDKPLSRALLAQVLYEVTNGKLDKTNPLVAFKDIQATDYKDALDYCITTGLLKGTSATTMSPEKSVTRAEMMVILQRLDALLK